MEVALDQPLRECGAGVNGHTKNEIYHEVYFTSRDNKHKIPNNPNDPTSNYLNDTTFASKIRLFDDWTDAELGPNGPAAKFWYEAQSKTVP